jgi:hypothetical protein
MSTAVAFARCLNAIFEAATGPNSSDAGLFNVVMHTRHEWGEKVYDLLGGGVDYEADWTGECRIDPEDGNAYVLRSVGFAVPHQIDHYGVVINDILGGHTRTVALSEWIQWVKSDE